MWLVGFLGVGVGRFWGDPNLTVFDFTDAQRASTCEKNRQTAREDAVRHRNAVYEFSEQSRRRWVPFGRRKHLGGENGKDAESLNAYYGVILFMSVYVPIFRD